MLRSRRAAVKFSECRNDSSASVEPSDGKGRKSPSATRLENASKRSMRLLNFWEAKRVTPPETIKIKSDESHKLRRKDPKTSSVLSMGKAKRTSSGELFPAVGLKAK